MTRKYIGIALAIMLVVFVTACGDSKSSNLGSPTEVTSSPAPAPAGPVTPATPAPAVGVNCEKGSTTYSSTDSSITITNKSTSCANDYLFATWELTDPNNWRLQNLLARQTVTLKAGESKTISLSWPTGCGRKFQWDIYFGQNDATPTSSIDPRNTNGTNPETWGTPKNSDCPPTPAPTCSLSASPTSVPQGTASQLTITTANAISAKINGQSVTLVSGKSTLGVVSSLIGVLSIPGQATGTGGTASCSTNITFTCVAPKILRTNAVRDDKSQTEVDTFQVSWPGGPTTTNVTADDVTKSVTNGETVSFTLKAGVHQVTAKNPGGDCTTTVSVTVNSFLKVCKHPEHNCHDKDHCDKYECKRDHCHDDDDRD